MDRITIFERDISNIPAEDIGTNIVYVPGYAVMGPVNTPTLCQNLSEFQSIFGYAPYLFENAQTFESLEGFKDLTTGNLKNTGDRELSYIYACELLNKGLPVLFERVMTEEKIEAFTFRAKLYNLTNKLTQDTTIESASYLFAGSTIKSGSTINGNVISEDLKITETTNLIINDILNSGTEIALGSKINEIDEVHAENYLTIKIKNPGLFGNSITYDLNKNTGNTYKLVIKQDSKYTNKNEQKNIYLENPLIPKDIIFSIDYNSPYYFENLDNDLIEFESCTGELTELIQVTDQNFTNEATNLYEFEIKDLYKLMSGEFEVKDEEIESLVYNKETKTYNTNSLFTKLVDRGEYQVKFITSGAYPILDFYSYVDKTSTPIKYEYENFITKALLWTVAKRGDSIALIDYLNEYMGIDEGYKTPLDLKTRLETIFNPDNFNDIEGTFVVGLSNNREELTPKYGTFFISWGIYKSQIYKNENILPPSFGYLNSLAVSVKTNANWYPVAGVTRGLVPDLKQLCTPITNAVAEALQSEKGISINPITLIKPYGYTIWGNRTLHYDSTLTGLVASSFLHIRNLVCDVKKEVYIAAKKFMFEPISETLWLNFKSEIEPLLDKMKTGNGLTDYQVLRKATTEKATICAVIRLWAVDAVEKFDVTIELSDSYVNVE